MRNSTSIWKLLEKIIDSGADLKTYVAILSLLELLAITDFLQVRKASGIPVERPDVFSRGEAKLESQGNSTSERDVSLLPASSGEDGKAQASKVRRLDWRKQWKAS